MICVYACLSTRPEIWWEVLRTVPQVARSGRAMCAASCVFAAVTWITRCLLNLLTSDELELVMHAVKL